MDNNSAYRTNITGAGEAGVAVSVDMNKNVVHQTNRLFWDTTGSDLLGETALPFYG